jgi:predicted TIM-barrel fold metal-dependent hydrolase
LIHIGGAALPPLDRSAIEVAEQYPNITLSSSAVPETAVLRALERLGPERVCFGSGTPFFCVLSPSLAIRVGAVSLSCASWATL